MKYLKIALIVGLLGGTAYAGGVSLGGYMRGVYCVNLSDSTAVSNFDFKNVSLSISGNLGEHFSIFVQPNVYSNFLVWAYMDIKLNKMFNIRYGKMVVPFGVEGYTAPFLLLTPEYSMVTTAKSFPGVDVGIYAHGELPMTTYYLGVFNGDRSDDKKSVIARLEFTPPLPLGKLTVIPSFYNGKIGGSDVTDIDAGFKWNVLGGDIWAEYFQRKVDTSTTSGFQFTAAYRYNLGDFGIQPVVKYGMYEKDKEIHSGVNFYYGPFRSQVFFVTTKPEVGEATNKAVVLLQVVF